MTIIEWPSRRISVEQAKAGAHALPLPPKPTANSEAERMRRAYCAKYGRTGGLSDCGSGIRLATPHVPTEIVRRAADKPPITFSACRSESSACRGGRLPCPTPEACRVCVEGTGRMRSDLANVALIVGGFLVSMAAEAMRRHPFAIGAAIVAAPFIVIGCVAAWAALWPA